ncbi:lysophospholipid acyltransferase family protein [Segnochrobactraceae bacterium EtOH-i3]
MARRSSLPPPLLAARQYLEYAGVRAGAALVRLLPLTVSSWVIGKSWRLIAPHLRRQKRVLEHMALALPEKTEAERRAISLSMWENLGRVMAETVCLDRLVRDTGRFIISYDKVQHLDLSRGVVLVSLHYGNWEISVLPAKAIDLYPVGVYQSVHNPFLDRYLRAVRAPYYKEILPKGPDTARRLIGTVKRGGSIAVLGDLRETRGILVSFFGRPAFANPLPAMVARMAGVPLVVDRATRLPDGRFLFDIVEVPVPRTDDRHEDVRVATAAVHARFEEWIREHPDQWMWAHRKWAAAPEDMASPAENGAAAAGEAVSKHE